MSVVWIPPIACDPPHKVVRPEQVAALSDEFSENGWEPDYPALVGYRLGNKIQLLSGSHRWAAAMAIGMSLVPIILRDLRDVERSWGHLSEWREIMDSQRAGEQPVAIKLMTLREFMETA